jgi:uncharacterized protein YndB with AHSA1/START domain
MTPPSSVVARVTHQFDASAERVYDGFLDPADASRFLFATPTGRIVRCEIDARVGGVFTIVDRRHGQDVVHTGTYHALDRPRRIVFTLSVPTYGSGEDTVTIDIVPRAHGCELTLSHGLVAKAHAQDGAQDGWTAILDVAGELLVDSTPTCGLGLARHATIPSRIATMLDGLAQTLELHRQMLVLDEANARQEDQVYGDLAARWTQVAALVSQAAAQMGAQRELPMGAHDPAAWGQEHLRAFETFVRGQSQLLALLRVAAERDEQMLASMQRGVSG